MREQWKKLDSDGKLLVDVEEGKQLPIKINIPLTALTPPRDEFCCNRLLTVLRVFVLLALLTLLGWMGASIYSNYYYRSITVDEESLENKFAFQNLIYKNKDDFTLAEELKKSESEEFRDSTKKALDQIATQMRGFNERLDLLQVEKQRQQMEMEKTAIDASDRSDQTLDSIMDELAKEVGLAENQGSDIVQVKYKPELDAIIVTEPCTDDFSDLRNQLEQDKINLMSLLDELTIESKLPENIDEHHEDYDFRNKFISHQPEMLDNRFLKDTSNEDAQFDTVIGNSDSEGNDDTFEQAREEFLGFLDRITAEAVIPNVEDSHEDDKEMMQVIPEVIDRMATNNLENSNGSEQQNEKGDKEKDESVENQNNESDFIETLLGLVMNEAARDNGLSGRFDFENVEESHVEDKIEKEMMKQLDEDRMLTEFFDDSFNDGTKMEDKTEMEIEDKFVDDGSGPSLLDELMNLIINDDDENKEDSPGSAVEEKSTEYNPQSVINTPFQIMSELGFFGQENKEVNDNAEASIQEGPSEKKPTTDLVPSVEYVKKIEGNAFIPRLAKMLEPIVGQNHELLIWYYTHKNLPHFLRGVDKWKVFGAKLLYDSKIEDFPADATIVSGLAFEKVYGGAEYPSSSEEVRSDLQQEIVNKLIFKSYLNKMLLEGNAEVETLSQVIEQHNQNKLKELDIDPQQLTYGGGFYEVDVKYNDDFVIPVVKFDPFVDDSKEANEQRAQVIKAFGMTRNFDDTIIKPSYKKYSQGIFGLTSPVAPEPDVQSELSTARLVLPTFEDVKENAEALDAEIIKPSHGSIKSEKLTETTDAIDWLTEYLPKEQTTYSTLTEVVSEEVSETPANEYEEENSEEDYYAYN